jgi:imidazolonepropionase
MNLDNFDLVIIHANELVTMDSKYGAPRIGENLSCLGIIRDGAIGVKGSTITFVGTTSELRNLCDLNEHELIIDATGKLVTPGLVDPHTHIIFEGSREDEFAMKLAGKSYLEILKAGGGILKTVRATREATKEKLIANGLRTLITMLNYGTTTIETKSGYGLTTESEIKSLEVARMLNEQHPIDVVSTFLGAHAIPPEYADYPEKYTDLIIEEMIPKIAEMNLADFCDVFCEKDIFSIDQTRKILQAAKDHELLVQLHADEIVDTQGAALAAELNAIQAGHLLKSNVSGLKAMATKGVIATLLPGTPFCLMLNEYAPARKMIELGIPIALATDFNPNCWIESMQMILALACYNMKLTPAEALSASTINAACAIKKGHLVGSLENGKQADIVIFSVPNHNFLAYRFGVNLVSHVVKKGDIVCRLDESHLI